MAREQVEIEDNRDGGHHVVVLLHIIHSIGQKTDQCFSETLS